MPADGAIGFRRVTSADLALLAEWMQRPHWRRWWGDPETELAEIASGLDHPDFAPFLILVDGNPAGYIQWWRPDGSWTIPVDAPPATTRGIDLSLARAEDCGKGLGTRVLGAFVARLAAEGISRFIIDPAPDNHAARRAYAKAGFVEVAEGRHRDGPYVLMLLVAVAGSGPAARHHRRGARDTVQPAEPR
jgi:aminoglycoside 6'-N-acetyltransferase